jgi:hypothetical protein
VKLKAGVDVHGVRPELVLALQVAAAVYAGVGAEMVVTSLLDGRHRRGSFHYQGAAADLRVHVLPDDRDQRAGIAAAIGEALGEDFDVIYEGHGTANAHIHLEYQRKG